MDFRYILLYFRRFWWFWCILLHFVLFWVILAVFPYTCSTIDDLLFFVVFLDFVGFGSFAVFW